MHFPDTKKFRFSLCPPANKKCSVLWTGRVTIGCPDRAAVMLQSITRLNKNVGDNNSSLLLDFDVGSPVVLHQQSPKVAVFVCQKRVYARLNPKTETTIFRQHSQTWWVLLSFDVYIIFRRVLDIILFQAHFGLFSPFETPKSKSYCVLAQISQKSSDGCFGLVCFKKYFGFLATL